MSNKQKMIFRGSITINLFLILIVIWGYVKIDFAIEQLFFTEVQENLVELEGLIAHQKANNWSEPNSVTTELGDILDGLYLGISNGKYLGWISNDDKEILEELSSKLRQYPHDGLYNFATLTQADINNFEELQIKLREVGLGLNVTISNDWNSFMEKSKALEEKIKVLLN